MRMTRLALGACALLALAAPAQADQINTGGSGGAYNTAFCPPMAAALKEQYFNYSCTPSAGTGENIARVKANPKQVSLAQGDVFAYAAAEDPALLSKVVVARRDVANECVFAVTTNPSIRNIGDIAKAASRIPIILPPETSGAAATFKLLQKIDPEGLGRARGNITYASDATQAITQALSSPGAVAFFVQLADPNNSNFKLIADRKGRFVPVVDRNILRFEIGGAKVYVPETVSVTAGGWTGGGESITTTCTPLLFLTGNPEALPAASNERKDQEDLVTLLKGIEREKLLPTAGNFAWLKAKVRAVSQDAIEALNAAADAARR